MSDVPPSPPPPPPSGGFGTPQPARGPDMGAALSYGWKKFTENVGGFILVVLVPLIVLLAIDFIGIFVVRGIFGVLVFYALALLVSMIAYYGIFNAALMATRGEAVDVGRAFQNDNWGAWIPFAIVYGLMVGIGAVFCGIGALIVIAFFGLAPYYAIDQKKGVGDALSASLDATRSNSGLALALAVCALVGWAGGLVCIGGLITYPVAIVAGGFLYRGVTGQSVAD